MGWIGSVRLKKIPTRLHGTNFFTTSARFARSFVRQPNSPKCTKQYKTHQNMSLQSNGVDRVRSLRKIMTRFRGTNFCTSLARFALSVVTHPNCPKCTQIVQNEPKHEVRVQWGGSEAFVSKNSDTTSWHRHLHHFGRFARSFVRQTNSTKCTQIV